MFTWRRKWELPRDIRLDGKILKLDQSTKFLGIYLDFKLSFNEHIKHVTKKATTSLMQCSKAVGPTWGPTPRSCQWIYEKAIRPILRYGSLVWINALQKKHNVNALAKVERLALRMISGAMPSTPTIALNQLTNTTFINNYIEGEAAKSLLRVKASGNLTRENPVARKGQITPHTYAIKQYINKLNLPKVDIDISVKKLYLNKAFVTCIRDRTEATKFLQQLKIDDIAVYNDRSGLDGNVGYGYRISTNKNQTKIADSNGRLPSYSTVFQAEVVAITRACEQMKELNIRNKNIYIFSDSLSAINALSQHRVSSITILECLNRINDMTSNNSVSLYWVPSHSNIPGNDEADRLSKEGTKITTYEKAYIPYSYIKKTINKKVLTNSSKTWILKQSNHMKQTININNNLCRDLQKLMNIRKKYR